MLTYKAALVAGAMILSTGAIAQNFEFGPNGVLVDRERNIQEHNYRFDRGVRIERDMIDQRQAVSIARTQGVDRVERVRESRGSWTIDGQDRRGDDIFVRVSLRGEVLDVSRD